MDLRTISTGCYSIYYHMNPAAGAVKDKDTFFLERRNTT
jgi:hypothetical protein